MLMTSFAPVVEIAQVLELVTVSTKFLVVYSNTTLAHYLPFLMA